MEFTDVGTEARVGVCLRERDMERHFWLPGNGEMPVPCGADRDGAVTAAVAARESGYSLESLRTFWDRTLGRVVGGGEGEEEGEGAEGVAAGLSEAEAYAEWFRAYWYPQLDPAHWLAFRRMCQERGINWRAREAFPRVEERGEDGGGGERVVIVTSIEVLRARAHATGQYAGYRLEHDVDGQGRVWSSTAHVQRVVEGVTRPFEATAYWEEYYWWLGDPPSKEERLAGVTEEQRRGRHPPSVGGSLAIKMPRVCLGRSAEAMALRAAFTKELAGLYAEVEMPRAGSGAGAGGAGGRAGGRRTPHGVSRVTPYGVDGPREFVPETLLSLQRELLARDDWDTPRWREAVQSARELYAGVSEAELCRRILEMANKRRWAAV